MKRKELIAAVEKAARPTILDRVVRYVSPSAGLRRYESRVRMALAGGYTGASRTKRSLKSWTAPTGDADDALAFDRKELQKRSHDLVRNHPVAAGIIGTKTTNVVGTGLVLNARVDRDVLGLSDEQADALEAAIEREWALFAETPECDYSRSLVFVDQQALAYRSCKEVGDVFVVMPNLVRPGSPYGIKVQLVEGERVSNPDRKADSDKIASGIEKDAKGSPVAYHFCNVHPDSVRDWANAKWTRVAAFGARTGRRNVLHLYRPLRIGQTRGVPDLASVIEPLKMLGELSENELMASVVSSVFTVFVKSDTGEGLAPMAPTSETGASTNDEDMKLGSGNMIDLAPGEDVEFANPNRPNGAFDPFWTAIVKQIAIGVGLPFEIVVKAFQSSYSASRAAMLEAWRYFSEERAWLKRSFCQPIYEAWFEEAVALGRINAPGFVNGDPIIRKAYLGSEWIGAPRGLIDPVKENEADKMAEDYGWTTGSANAAARGGDWLRINRQRKKEVQMRRDAGLEDPPQAQKQRIDINQNP